MKKIIALLLTTMFLTGMIQPVCATQTAGNIEAAIPKAIENLQLAPEQDIQNLSPSGQSKGDRRNIVSPDQAEKSDVTQEGNVKFEYSLGKQYDQTKLICNYGSPIDSYNSWLYYSCSNTTDSPVTLSISNSNANVLKITSEKELDVDAGHYITGTIKYKVIGVGYTDIIASTGNTSFKFRLYVLPYIADYPKITQTDFHHITLKWKKVPGCDGYYVQRSKNYNGEYETLKTLSADKTSITLPVKWNKEYFYQVVGYVKDDLRTLPGEAYQTGFTAQEMAGSSITSVKKSGSSNLVIRWNAFKNATGYKLYQSNQENGTYKCIYTDRSGKTTFYKQKVTKGIPYYYKLVTMDAMGESDFSPTVSQIIPNNNKVKKVLCSKISQESSGGFGQYSYHWAHPDTTYYYQSGGKFHAVCVQNNGDLKIYTLNASFKVTNTKTIKLKYDVWGGFYQGTDGKFYVAIGYDNPKESKSKIVIKVIQFDGKWKRLKTANIKGGVFNTFQGIYAPFDAGNCRMDMQGNTLYLMTAREMFTYGDGYRHQSNISFKINTKKMKAAEANESYASHSFNQFVKFKDDMLYLLDHGDAYPRGLELTTVSNYGADNQTISSSSLFSLKGETGANFTGCRVGGMEIGTSNVLVCGTSQPHGKKIKNISGFGYDMKYNAFLILSNRNSGKVTFKWLTTHNPKTTSVTVGETRMIKLTDNRFVILYSTTKKGTSTLNYAVYSDTGKKIYSKKYSNMAFDGDSQPILYNGSIVWISTTQNSGKATSKVYAIPATF